VIGGTEEPVSLTEALRAGAPEAHGVLYDEYAAQLHAYCHIMVGDEAAEAVRDAFIAVARHPGAAPADDEALPVWLHALVRSECVRRGALVRRPATTPSSDPIRRALARLRPEHREAVALSATLEPTQIARVIGVAPDTAGMLVQMARRRLEQAAVAVLGSVRDDGMATALGEGTLHRLAMRGYEPPARQRERVLSSCAEAERAPDGALLFDADGMPIPLDALFGRADEPTRPFAQVGDDPVAATAARHVPKHAAPDDAPTVRIAHARPKKEPFLSRRDGLVEVAGLAACVAAATSVLALWPSPHGDGAANMNGTSLFLHRGTQASRSAQPVRPPSTGAPPQAATSKPGTSASPSPTKATTSPAASAPPKTTTSTDPAPTSGHGSSPAHPTPPTAPTPTPTPADPPTAGPSDSPGPQRLLNPLRRIVLGG
jgi:DNA-directed RNA polymerase specialized sigma24 family protein